jgi:hypothetical protein
MMRNKILLRLILILLPSIVLCQQIEKDTIKVFYLGGQSNMTGYGYNKELPKASKAAYKNILIYQGNPVADEKENGGLGVWEVLKPGHGKGFTSNGTKNSLSKRFGIELSFAKKLQELYPNEKIALIKYARAGSSLDTLAADKYGSWDVDYKGVNGINQYDNFLKTIKYALNTADIDNDGIEDVLIPSGIVWMQGESDAAYTEEIASDYYDNLKRLMNLMRASLHTDDLPVVIGKISDSWNDKDGIVWEHGDLVQYAQEKYVKTATNAAIVRSTRYYTYSDKWHYDTKGYLDLGEQFAEAIYLLNKK